MATPITASMLYNLVQCPKRVALDLYGDVSIRDKVSPFVQMLWERGAAYEQEVMASGNLPALDLSDYEGDEKERLTLEAMRRGEPLIYGGRISADDLLGIPDLLRRSGQGYVPVEIKSGGAEEGGGDDNDGKPKLHYAVQLALYVDVLERLGLSAGRLHGPALIHADGTEECWVNGVQLPAAQSDTSERGNEAMEPIRPGAAAKPVPTYER